jgi:hypothetical protein
MVPKFPKKTLAELQFEDLIHASNVKPLTVGIALGLANSVSIYHRYRNLNVKA